MAFDWPVRVYYEDTDAGGVVYHSQYLNFCERARTEWLRALGIEQPVLLAQDKLVFVVHSLSANYLQPAKFDDALIIRSTIEQMSRASIAFNQLVLRDEQVLFEMRVKVASVDADKMRACKMPESLRAIMMQAMST